uniref:C-C motif chemokine n=1 Tax=Camelus bactrianus TaxID=9837 RepID=A0A9W3F6E1_CAMBA|nr:C-C motif chemokine 22 [Camelus bactrianus]
MASLQTPLLAALILLAMILQATEAGEVFAANVEDSICCRDYIRHPLPPRVVKYYYWTSDSCRRPGVVLLTVRDREICADPRLPWVKKILHRLDK